MTGGTDYGTVVTLRGDDNLTASGGEAENIGSGTGAVTVPQVTAADETDEDASCGDYRGADADAANEKL